jgi:hypothetical protein
MRDTDSLTSWIDEAEAIARSSASDSAAEAVVRNVLAELRRGFRGYGWTYELLRLLRPVCPPGALDAVLTRAARCCVMEGMQSEPGEFLAFDDLTRLEPDAALAHFAVLLEVERVDAQALAHFADALAAVPRDALLAAEEGDVLLADTLATCARRLDDNSASSDPVLAYARRRCVHALDVVPRAPPPRPPLRAHAQVGSDGAYLALFDPEAFAPGPARLYRYGKDARATAALVTAMREQRALGFGTGGDGGWTVRFTDGPLEPEERETSRAHGAFALAAPSGLLVLEGDEDIGLVALPRGAYRVDVHALDADDYALARHRNGRGYPSDPLSFVFQLAPLEPANTPAPPDGVPVFWG